MRRFTTKQKTLSLFVAVLSALAWAWTTHATPEQGAIFMRAVDGDTLEVAYQGQKERVRLIGVDTPESSSNPKAIRDAERTHGDLETIIKMGKQARAFLQSLVKPRAPVKLEFDAERRDKYGRLLAYVYLPDGRMLNEVLVAEGYAQAFTVPPNVKYAKVFRVKAGEARKRGLGLWGQSRLGD